MPKLNFKLAAALVPVFCLTGCVTQYRQPVTLQARKTIGNDQLTANTGQSNLQPEIASPVGASSVYIPPATSANISPAAETIGVGIGALIAGAIMAEIHDVELRHALRDIKPLQVRLKNFDVLNRFSRSLKSSLSSISWLSLDSVVIKKKLTAEDERASVAYNNYKTNLFVNLAYNLNYHFNAIAVRADVKLSNKNKNSKAGLLYKNQFLFIHWLPENIDSRKQAMALWDKNNGRLAKSTLKEGAKLVADAIALDMLNPNFKIYDKVKSRRYDFKVDYGYTRHGKFIKKIEGYYLLRAPTGRVVITNRVTPY